MVFELEEVFKVSLSVLTGDVKSREQDTVFLQHCYFGLVFGHKFLFLDVKSRKIILLEGVC